MPLSSRTAATAPVTLWDTLGAGQGALGVAVPSGGCWNGCPFFLFPLSKVLVTVSPTTVLMTATGAVVTTAATTHARQRHAAGKAIAE